MQFDTHLSSRNCLALLCLFLIKPAEKSQISTALHTAFIPHLASRSLYLMGDVCVEDDFDTQGNECPNCLVLINQSAPDALFYTCGCFVCPSCSEEVPRCPIHGDYLHRSGDRQLQMMLIQVQRLHENYEQTYTDDRSALDAMVKQARKYVQNQRLSQSNQSQPAYQPPVSQSQPVSHSLPAFQQLPEFTNICPNCHIQVQGLKCQCGFVNLGMVNTKDMRTVREEATVPVSYARETEYVTCRHCRQSLTPKGETHCYSCGVSLNSCISSVWRCPGCSYGYNMEASCLKCHTPKPGATPPKPSVPAAVPKQSTASGSTIVWACPCGYEYNLQTASTCQTCKRPKGGETPPGWQCQCGAYNAVDQSSCSQCDQTNIRSPQPKADNHAARIVASLPVNLDPSGSDAQWTCKKCKRSNPNTTISCNYCKTPKVQLTTPPAAPRRYRGS